MSTNIEIKHYLDKHTEIKHGIILAIALFFVAIDYFDMIHISDIEMGSLLAFLTAWGFKDVVGKGKALSSSLEGVLGVLNTPKGMEGFKKLLSDHGVTHSKT